ncbi:MAG: hypothetical protein A4E24_01214 [Methanomethylovorans sp. PtaU1.Bin093]|jgi:hypothetical protein|nr:MAG: hypothetical protein A4E24_01214 [Methanomethylovorans sp. PtaU1.Bin093]
MDNLVSTKYVVVVLVYLLMLLAAGLMAGLIVVE